MSITNYTLVKSIDASLVNVLLKVRIVKLWTLKSFKIKNGIHAYELVLMDEEGSKIQATVMNTYLKKFEKFLVEKSCLVIGNPVIGDNVVKNPVLQHPHRLFFNFETEVSNCDNFEGSFHGFSLVDFDVLQSNEIPTESTVDVIGYVYTFFPKEDHKTKAGKTVKKLNMQLRDLQSRNIFVTLWEAYANEMYDYLQNKEEGVATVLLLQLGKYYFSGGRAYVHSQYNATILFINKDDIKEIVTFKNSLLQIELSDSTSTRQLVASQYASNSVDEFLTQTVFNSIEEVNKLAEVKSVVMGTVITFAPGGEWYYLACKTCNKKLTDSFEDGKKLLTCPTEKCNQKTIVWVPRFKIPLRVQDSTGVISLTLFERDAKKLFSKSAKEFVDLIMDGDSGNLPTDKINEANLKLIPVEITDLVGRKFAFKIDVTSFNVDNNYKSFAVKKFTEDPEIISKLEAALDIEPVQTPDSRVLKAIEFGSQETVFKASSSCSAENIFIDEDISNNFAHDDLKRNLVEIYDDAGCEDESATKKRQDFLEDSNSTLKQRNLSNFESNSQSLSMLQPSNSTSTSNFLNMDLKGIDSRERRSLRKAYLDSKRPTRKYIKDVPSNVKNLDITGVNCKENRRLRKLYLDSKKSNNLSNVAPYRSPLSNITSGINLDTPNINYKENRMLRKLVLYKKRSNVISNEQLFKVSSKRLTSGSKGKENRTQKDLLTPSTSSAQIINQCTLRSSLSDITKDLNCCSNITATPLSNIRLVNLSRDMTPLFTTPTYITMGESSSGSHENSYKSIAKQKRDLRRSCLRNNKSKDSSAGMKSMTFGDENILSENLLSRSENNIECGSKRRRFTSPDTTFPNIQEFNDDHIRIDPFIGVSPDYKDHGDQSVMCELCRAQLWKAESAKGKKRVGNLTCYSVCCSYGKVELPGFKEPPPEYKQLFSGSDAESKFFLKNIRRYNSMFAFTSMGGKIDRSINRGNAPYIFRLYGQNYHLLGSLLPEDGCIPKFSQLYIYDTENEVYNRQSVLGDSSNASSSAYEAYDVKIIEFIKDMLDSINSCVKSYRMARDSFVNNPHLDVQIRLVGRRSIDGRTYNHPEASEVAALIVGDIGDAFDNRDIIVKTKTGELQRINELHPLYLALQYPILFPYGSDGYRVDILHRDVIADSGNKRQYVTMREFFAFIIQDRKEVFSTIHSARRLFQQFLVDAYTMIESERLNYVRFKQSTMRSEKFETLRNLRNSGSEDFSKVGTRVILPSSFTGGARYMMQNYLDAMSICKWYGYPDFFITVTCNPKWPEVMRFLQDTNLKSEDRPDILCRIFKIKLDSLVKDLKDNSILGRVSAVIYTVEFQKRGLPHAHICIFMHPDDKFPTVDMVDPIISAEIPDKNEDLELYTLVSEYMIHGPCGGNNLNCPCMINNKCSKNFPKPFREYTSVDSNGYPLYRRRDDQSEVEKSGVKLDNRSVIPYNKTLLKKYQSHINVEWCNQGGSIKYLFKYINKGPDRITATVADSENVDEIQDYYDCRYISACEATWRIFSYDVNYRYPPVIRLPFHLPNQQNVCYEPTDDIDYVLNKPSVKENMFVGWMDCNKSDAAARNLSYVEFPTKFVWKNDQCRWARRKHGFSIGRIHACSPGVGEGYYLRILLNKVKGPTSFDDILTVNGVTYATFKEACFALGLLDDDREYIEAIEEASLAGMGHYLRKMFVMILTMNCMSRPEQVWEKTWQILADDILYRQRLILDSSDLSLSEDQIKNLTLSDIEKKLNRNNSTLRNWITMPYPDHDSVSSSNNRFITDELNYDKAGLLNEFNSLYNALNNDQMHVYQQIIDAVSNKTGGVFFVYGYGGTGKTYLWKTLSACVRSKGEIVLNVASSGIASLLLSGGRTAHSRFHIPINLTEDSICHIKPNTDVAELLKKTSLIIWDEAPMTHRHAFEALDRSLKDVLSCEDCDNSEMLFGGKTVVFGGDFRQILPVIQSGSRQDIVNAALCSSYIWHDCKVLRLTINMRLFVGTDVHDVVQTRNFAQWLLDLGEGKIGGANDGDATIEIPDDLLIMDPSDPISNLFEFVYPSLLQNFKNSTYLQERAILAPTNEVVDEINDRFLSNFPGTEKEYLSSDSICRSEHVHKDFDASSYSPDVLNGLKISGLPNHKLVLKVGVPVMLLRNIDHKSGLCNGTRLKIVALGNRVIEAEVISGSNIGSRTFITRIALTPSEKSIPFKFQRRQFPLAVCFAMTVNKSQGQSLSRVGLFLKKPVFSHGQLYVALSRVKSRDGLKLLILDEDGNVTNKTSNVVYKEIFRNL